MARGAPTSQRATTRQITARRERSIAQGYLVEGPTWAPNGRVLAYFKEDANGGRTRLYTIDLTGYNEREVVTPLDASDPAWSPLIQ